MKIRRSAIIAHVLLTLPYITTASFAIIHKRQRIAPSISFSLQSPTSTITISTPPPSITPTQPTSSILSTTVSDQRTNSTTLSTSIQSPQPTTTPQPQNPTATHTAIQESSTPLPSHSMSPAALTGVVLAGVALVILSGAFLWLVHFRTTGMKKPSPFRRASVAVREVQVRRAGHIRIEDFVASNMSTMSGTGFGAGGIWDGSQSDFSGTGTGNEGGTGTGMGTIRVGYV